MRTIVWACALAAVGGLWLSGCSTTPKSQASRENLETEVQASIQTAKNTDPGLQKFFDTSAGYAVFPKVGKAAWVVGGAYGKGILYERGQPAGYCDLTQATVGLSAGAADVYGDHLLRDAGGCEQVQDRPTRPHGPGFAPSP